MISVTPEVEAVLNSDAIWYADLFTFSLVSGDVLRYTSADTDVMWGGNTWKSKSIDGAPMIERGEVTFETGLTVDQLEIDIYTDESMTVGGLPWPQAIRVGLLNAAEVKLERAVAQLGQQVAGVIPRFVGKVGPCTPGRMHSTITVESLLAYLSAPVPSNSYQPSCQNTIYDGTCALDRASRETIVTVSSISADFLTVGISGATLAASAYVGGFARFTATSGPNKNQQVTVSDNTSNTVTILYPFPGDLMIGDQIALAPGCPKTKDACSAYGNLPRFRGHTEVPVPETMV